VTARRSTKRAPRRPSATGGRPSSSSPSPSAPEADDILESLVRSISTVIREELQRVRPVLVAGLEAGANYRLCSPSALRRLRARAGAGEPAS
jgi:hypothetical protein